jgi:hypothetical protein
MLGTESFEIVALDRLSNKGIVYLSVNAVPFNATLDNLETGTAITPTAPTVNEPDEDENIIIQGDEVTISTNFGYVLFEPVVEILTRNLTSVTFVVPYSIETLEVVTKDSSGNLVTTNYQVVI